MPIQPRWEALTNRSCLQPREGEELGFRGSHGQHIFWETELFRLDTKNDFERYRMTSRPLETFMVTRAKAADMAWKMNSACCRSAA